MLRWESVKSEFIWEGSWRDVYVVDVGPAEWGAAVRAIVDAGFRSQFTVDGAVADLPHDLTGLFMPSRQASAVWSVWVSGVQVNCHFFDESEIEFDFDPREVTGQSQLDELVRLMRTLARATSKAALMTPENMPQVPFIRVAPSGEAEYISSDGFYESSREGEP